MFPPFQNSTIFYKTYKPYGSIYICVYIPFFQIGRNQWNRWNEVPGRNENPKGIDVPVELFRYGQKWNRNRRRSVPLFLFGENDARMERVISPGSPIRPGSD